MAKVAVETADATTIVAIDRFVEGRNAVDPETAILLRSLDVPAALVSEARHGVPALQAESRKGTARFAAGRGRGGDFGEI